MQAKLLLSEVRPLALTSLTQRMEREAGQPNISPTTLHIVDLPVPGLPTTSSVGNTLHWLATKLPLEPLDRCNAPTMSKEITKLVLFNSNTQTET